MATGDVGPGRLGDEHRPRASLRRPGSCDCRRNPAAIALANTLARIAWAVWTTDTPFAAQPPRPSTLTLTEA
ncbi:MAG: hypothetical protein U0802_16840 [Candidatus Binatia bacterium]